VPLEAASVTATAAPMGNTSAWLQFPGAGPAGTVKPVPATTKLNIPPVGTPVPAILQILRRPVVDVFRNVTIVVPPALTVTVAVPTAKLLVTSRPAGKVVTDVSAIPDGMVSVISAGPDGAAMAGLQEPPGAGPAGTESATEERGGRSGNAEGEGRSYDDARTGDLANLKKAVDGEGIVAFTNVTMVVAPTLTVTVAVPAPRLLSTSEPAGEALTAVSA